MRSECALRVVAEVMAEDPSLSFNAVVIRIGPRVGVVPDTLWGWIERLCRHRSGAGDHDR